ncbi:MAG: YbhB/YbcL family Raf kinase inhibitor-like protein [Actinomycetota bacterium]|nr:YbhB/YbcL family Raf kinase inhibitor-like protein [Actinomycetota bacterium]
MNLGDLSIRSSAFGHDDPIPTKYASDGDDVSPPLEWTGVPEGTRQFALIIHDPDAPVTYGCTHWMLYGIPPSTTSLEEGGGSEFTAGENYLGNQGYDGPAPPSGHGTHHYFFHLYALDVELDAEPGLTRLELLDRIDGHIIEQARVVGTYET